MFEHLTGVVLACGLFALAAAAGIVISKSVRYVITMQRGKSQCLVPERAARGDCCQSCGRCQDSPVWSRST